MSTSSRESRLGYINGYPKVVIEPDVDTSAQLRDRLLADEADLIILPDSFADTRSNSKPLGTVDNAWMCKPGLMDAHRRRFQA